MLAFAFASAFACSFAFASLLEKKISSINSDQISQLSATPPKKGNLLMVVSMKARQFAVQFKSDFSEVASNSQEVTTEVRCMMNHGL